MSNIVVRDMKDTLTMADAVTKSGLFGFKNTNQALTMLLLAESENMHPMSAVKAYHIVGGKPVLKSAEVLSRFQNADGKIKYLVSNDNECEIEFSHPQGGSLTIKWDIEKAKKAGIYNTNPVWQKYPSNMLRSRCVTDGVTALFPSCLGGNMPETVAEDIAPSKVTTLADKEEVIEVEAEIEELTLTPEPTIGTLKLRLANKLKELSFSNGDIKSFADMFELADNKQLLERVVNEPILLNEMVSQFEEESE